MKTLLSDTAFKTAAGLALLASAAAAQSADEQPEPPEVDPEVIQAVKDMGAALRALPAFSIEADLIWEEVMDSGEKITVIEQIAAEAAPPNRLRMEQSSPQRTRIFYFNGEQATLWSPGIGYYAQVDFKGSLPEMIAEAANKYDFEIPLADLFLWGAEEEDIALITSARHIGLAAIGGRVCDQFAFRQKDVDWQLWIEATEPPTPCGYSITDLTDEARPTFNAIVTVTPAEGFSDGRFTFVPPEESWAIGFEAETAEAPEQ